MAQLINVPDDQLVDGQVVKVISSQNVMSGVRLADSVEVEGFFDADDGFVATEIDFNYARLGNALPEIALEDNRPCFKTVTKQPIQGER